MRIVLASGNADKLAELTPLLAGAQVAGAPDGFGPEETGTTLLQNALIKARALRERLDAGELDHDPGDTVVVADDSGLVVHALGGRPGVFSARYAGPDATYVDNCRRLLEELQGADDRTAAFVCVLVGLPAGERVLVACGTCAGTIAPSLRGGGGFGYDPVFVPEGERRSMAQMTAAEKARVSHRGRAARRMAALLDLAG